MDGDNNMKIIKIILLNLIILILLHSVYSAGVSSPYSETIPLVMAPGQTYEFYLELQNMVGNEDLKFTAKINSGSEFLEITDTEKEYLVPVGRKDIKVNVKVTLPEDTEEGDYDLSLEFKMVPLIQEGGSMVNLDQGVVMNFPLQVEEGATLPGQQVSSEVSLPSPEEQPAGKGNLWWVVALVIVLVIIVALLIRKKK